MWAQYKCLEEGGSQADMQVELVDQSHGGDIKNPPELIADLS